MKKYQVLVRARDAGQMVRFEHRSVAPGRLEGYVVGLSERFVLIHRLDPNLFLNGYTALRVGDVKKPRALSDADFFALRALTLRGEHAVPQPDILLLDLPGLLSSASTHFPLVSLHCDKILPNTCFIGRVKALTGKHVTLSEIDPSARWRYTRRFKLKNITRVDFGGGYEDALWRVSEYERRRETKWP